MLQKPTYRFHVLNGMLKCQIRIGGDKAALLSLREKLEPSQFDLKRQKVRSIHPRSSVINKKINRFKEDGGAVFDQLLLKFGDVTKEAFNRHFDGSGKVQYTFVDFVDIWLDQRKSEVGVFLSQSAYETYKTKCLQIRAYFAAIGSTDIEPEQVTPQMLSGFLVWLIKTKGYKSTHANKIFDLVRAVFKYANKNKLTDCNPSQTIRDLGEPEPDLVFLEESEIQAIEAANLFGKQVVERDIFLLSCELSFHAVDMARLKQAKFETDKDGISFLTLPRHKTRKPATVLLSDRALKLIEKYGSIDNFPIEKCLWKRNARLKIIADAAGINKNLSTKVGRKSFANSRLNGEIQYSETSVCVQMGLTTAKYLKHYGNANKERLKNEYLKQTARK